MAFTEQEQLLIDAINCGRRLKLPIRIGTSNLSDDELNTLVNLIERPNETIHVVHSVDISNVRELLLMIREVAEDEQRNSNP